jgi:hypothetical protein
MSDTRIRFRYTRQPIEAVEWRIGPARTNVRIKRHDDGRFAVTMGDWIATKGGSWEREPYRDDDYPFRCLWDDWEDAALMADRLLAAEQEEER